MKTTALASRYAKAYLALALDRNRLQEAVDGAKAALELLEENEAIVGMLRSPLIPSDEKATLSRRLLGDAIAAPIWDLIDFLLQKRRVDDLQEILLRIITLDEKTRGVHHAHVVSAVELTDIQARELSEKLKTETGAGQIILHRESDPGLLGGIRVKIEDTVWDGSVRGRLEELKKKYL